MIDNREGGICMATAIKKEKLKLTLEERYAIEESLSGYFTHEYVMPERTEETDVDCPFCNTKLILSRLGNSYSINCKTDSCVDITVRGL
jgi:hypothetical protein